MSCDVYRHLDGIHRDQHQCWQERDGRPVSPARREQYRLDDRPLQPGGMWWLRVETGKAVRR